MSTSFYSDIGKDSDVIVTIGDKRITSRSAILTSFQLSGGQQDYDSCLTRSGDTVFIPRARDCYELELTFKFSPVDAEGNPNLLMDIFTGSAGGIRHKLVSDCSVGELLFAAREKMRNG